MGYLDQTGSVNQIVKLLSSRDTLMTDAIVHELLSVRVDDGRAAAELDAPQLKTAREWARRGRKASRPW